MSKFPAWFNRAYKRWSRSQPGEEDFLAFCDLLGYQSSKVLGWLHGEFLPEGSEVLSIAGTFGINVYKVLDLPEPEPEFLKIYNSFVHLTGEYRGKISQAFYEVEQRIAKDQISVESNEAKAIIDMVLIKHGLKKI